MYTIYTGTFDLSDWKIKSFLLMMPTVIIKQYNFIHQATSNMMVNPHALSLSLSLSCSLKLIHHIRICIDIA